MTQPKQYSMLNEHEEAFVISKLNNRCLEHFIKGRLHPFDALVVARLPAERQEAFAVKLMNGTELTGTKEHQGYRHRRIINGLDMTPGSIPYAMR